MFLAERYQRFLSRVDSNGVIILDSRRPEVDERTRRFFERLKREGTPYVALDRIVDSLFGPSHHSIGLQAADLVIASTLAARRGQGDASAGTSSCCRASRGTGHGRRRGRSARGVPGPGEGRGNAAEQAVHRLKRPRIG